MTNIFMIVFRAFLMLLPAATREIRPRVVGGVPDDGHEFPFAVMLQYADPPMTPICSGSFIAPTWVLTAAHCGPSERKTRVKYGDTTIPSNETKFFANVIKQLKHPGAKMMERIRIRIKYDIALWKIERISNAPLAKLSAVDYLAFMGMPVKYAGFGLTHLLKEKNETVSIDRPLLVGEAVVISCKPDGTTSTQNICIAPRCGPRKQPYFGDSGGPLIYNGRVIGVCSGNSHRELPIAGYTAVSPFLEWIYNMVHSE